MTGDTYSEGRDTDALANRFRDAVNALDDLPLSEDELEWTTMLERFADGR
ncbi:hypothetical protein [Streptomyces sp. NPDC016845]